MGEIFTKRLSLEPINKTHADAVYQIYSSQVVEAMINHIQKLYNLQRIQAEIMPKNSASIKLLEKLGFVDLLMYARIFPVEAK